MRVFGVSGEVRKRKANDFRNKFMAGLLTLSATMQSANANYYFFLFICLPALLSRWVILLFLVCHAYSVLERPITLCVGCIANIIYEFSRMRRHVFNCIFQLDYVWLDNALNRWERLREWRCGLCSAAGWCLMRPSINDSVTRFATFGSFDDIRECRLFVFFFAIAGWHSIDAMQCIGITFAQTILASLYRNHIGAM